MFEYKNTTYDYIFFDSDESFDYDTPWGTATHYEYEPHGFSIELINKVPQIQTLKGIGIFEREVKKIYSLNQLYDFIQENYKHIQEPQYNSGYPRCSQFSDLLEFIEKEIKKVA